MKRRASGLTVRALQPIVSGLEALGFDTARLLESASIPRSLVEGDPDGTVPAGAVAALVEHAKEASGDRNLGLHLAEAAPIGSFEVHAYALLSSPSLREAYRRGCRYQRLIHDRTELVFEERPTEGVLRHSRPGGLSVPRDQAEFLVATWLRLGRLVAGRPWTPALVCFAHAAPEDLVEHHRVFGKHLLFSSGRTAMHVPSHLLDLANPGADEDLARMMDRYAESALRWAPSRETISGQVRALLVDRLSSGVPTAAAVARELHMSSRTLQRSLRAEGASFRTLVEQLRRERATELLRGRHCSIPEVGFLVGFSELSAFYRAFKRWTGRTPADFRAAAP